MQPHKWLYTWEYTFHCFTTLQIVRSKRELTFNLFQNHILQGVRLLHHSPYMIEITFHPFDPYMAQEDSLPSNIALKMLELQKKSSLYPLQHYIGFTIQRNSSSIHCNSTESQNKFRSGIWILISAFQLISYHRWVKKRNSHSIHLQIYKWLEYTGFTFSQSHYNLLPLSQSDQKTQSKL